MIPPLHIVTDDAILARPGFVSLARELIRGGAGEVAFHLRGPRTTGRKLFELASQLAEEVQETEALLLVNDRLDVVLALNLQGAHLGQRSLKPGVARGLLGPDRILGVSVHGRAEAEEAIGGGCHFLVVGALFATDSHPGAVPGGLDLLGDISTLAPPPMVGIGGVTPARVSEVLGLGASGVAVRGGIWDAPDPVAALAGYRDQIGHVPPSTKGGSGSPVGGRVTGFP